MNAFVSGFSAPAETRIINACLWETTEVGAKLGL